MANEWVKVMNSTVPKIAAIKARQMVENAKAIGDLFRSLGRKRPAKKKPR